MNLFIHKFPMTTFWALAIMVSTQVLAFSPQLKVSPIKSAPESSDRVQSQQSETTRWRQTQNFQSTPQPRAKYHGSGAMLGGLIGGGLATTLGGMLGDEFSIVIGGFGGMMGGALGSGADSTSNGLSILGAAVGGGIGAGLGIRLKEHLFRDTESNNKYSYKGLLDSASSTLAKPLEGVTKVAGAVAAPLESVASPVKGVLKKPIEGVTSVASPVIDVLKKPVEGVTGVINPIKNVFGKKKRALGGIPVPINPVTAVTDLAAAPVGAAVDVAAGSIFKAISKPLLAGVMSGIFGAIGGGTGALIGGWGLYVMQNLMV